MKTVTERQTGKRLWESSLVCFQENSNSDPTYDDITGLKLAHVQQLLCGKILSRVVSISTTHSQSVCLTHWLAKKKKKGRSSRVLKYHIYVSLWIETHRKTTPKKPKRSACDPLTSDSCATSLQN